MQDKGHVSFPKQYIMEAYCAGENIQVLQNSTVEGEFLALCPGADNHCTQNLQPRNTRGYKT
jgi:hypothetical protein